MDRRLDIQGEHRGSDRLQLALDELTVLNDIVSEIGSEDRVDRINKLILGICVHHFNVEQGVIHLLNPTDPNEMLKTGIRVRSEAQETVYQDSLRYRPGISLTGWMLRYQEPMFSNDLPNDSRFRTATDEMPNIRSVLAAPMKMRNRLMGILCLFNRLDDRPIDDKERQLLGIIAMQAAQVIENARLYEMEEDLRAARSIQQELLPKAAPRIAGLDTYGFAVAAHEVGGDLYDWARLPGNRLGTVLADVSGKGMSAALLMAHLQALFKSQAQLNSSPAQAVDAVNKLLRASLASDRFVTLFCAAVDAEKNHLTYVNAGHNPPLLVRADGQVEWLAEAGMILCPVSMNPYEEHPVDFRPGDVLVMFSDGVTEAEAPSGEQWGKDAFEEAVLQGPRDSARAVGEHIRARLEEFVSGHRQSDDITLVVIRHAG